MLLRAVKIYKELPENRTDFSKEKFKMDEIEYFCRGST